MTNYLAKLYTQQKLVSGNLFDNEAQIDILLNQVVQTHDSIQLARLLHQCARQYLLAGKPDSAILLYNSSYQLMRQCDTLLFAEQLGKEHLDLAKSWFRLGELQNCQKNHNNESCIYPLRGGGIQQFANGSQKAVNHLLQYLIRNPTDKESIWLLNIASLTLGYNADSILPGSGVNLNRFKSPSLFGAWANRTDDAGITFRGTTGGVCTEDFNNDGLTDIFITAWHLNENVRLYKNNGNGTFDDVTKQAGLIGITGGSQCITTDFDNDGRIDITILRGGWGAKAGHQPKSLLHNNGNFSFTDVAAAMGINTLRPCHTACWADFDKDGYLDLFMGNETNYYMGDYSDNYCELMMNKSGKGFINEASDANAQIDFLVKGVTATDVNNDGYPDIYVSMFGGKNLLLLNEYPQKKKVSFRNIAPEAGVEDPLMSFGVASADFNNDGLDDLFVASYTFVTYDFEIVDCYRNTNPTLPKNTAKLYINNGNNTYTDATHSYGLDKCSYNTMGLNVADFDNDGYMDLYLGTGGPDVSMLSPNILLRNIKGKYFTDITTSSRVGHLQKGHGVGIADIDNDGDNDLLMNLGGAYEGDNFNACLFENPAKGTQWIRLKLQGTVSNRCAIGARLHIRVTPTAGETLDIYNVINTGGSYGCSSLTKTIGLGTQPVEINYIEVVWPSGLKQKIKNTKPQSTYLITEGNSDALPLIHPSFNFITKTSKTDCCKPM